MPFAPGHFEQQQVRRRRYRSRRERLAVRAAALVAVGLLALVVFSLTTHQAGTGNGCIDFNYTTMIGGAEMHKCGAQARALCAAPAPAGRSVDTDFQTELSAACRKGGFPTRRSSSTSS